MQQPVKPIYTEASTHVGAAAILDAINDYANGRVEIAIIKLLVGLYGIFRRETQKA